MYFSGWLRIDLVHINHTYITHYITLHYITSHHITFHTSIHPYMHACMNPSIHISNPVQSNPIHAMLTVPYHTIDIYIYTYDHLFLFMYIHPVLYAIAICPCLRIQGPSSASCWSWSSNSRTCTCWKHWQRHSQNLNLMFPMVPKLKLFLGWICSEHHTINVYVCKHEHVIWSKVRRWTTWIPYPWTQKLWILSCTRSLVEDIYL